MELLVGEQTRITLEVSADAKAKLEMPQLKAGDTITQGVEVVDVAKPDTQQLNEGARLLISQSYTVTSFDSALYYLPPFVVKADGKDYQSKNLALRVLSVPVDTVHVDRFYGPKDIMEPPFSWSDWSVIFWLSVVLLLWVLMLSYIYIRFRDNKPIIKMIKLSPKVLPHTKAMQEFDQMKAEKAWAKEDSKEYYTRLTSILRTYIEKRYGFNAMEMTSSEIIDRLLKEQTNETLDELRTLFQTADLVKFAKHNTLINENDANLVNAIEFINQTKIEIDPKEKDIPDEAEIEQKRSKRTLVSMRMTLLVLTLAGVALLGWILWMVYGLIA
ncbi:MAG: hypothetical protein LUC45_01505 [Paraprevotella sp.]|nr:hypothetical protein [Paraprevotella sp.]